MTTTTVKTIGANGSITSTTAVVIKSGKNAGCYALDIDGDVRCYDDVAGYFRWASWLTPHMAGRIAAMCREVGATTEDGHYPSPLIPSLTYHVMPKDMGQIVEYAYAADWEHEQIYMRVTDASDGSVSMYVADLYDGVFEPQSNMLPETSDWREV